MRLVSDQRAGSGEGGAAGAGADADADEGVREGAVVSCDMFAVVTMSN
jgi:hypothetical protein